MPINVLIVCSGNFPNFDFKIHQAFIYDQVEAIKLLDPTIHFDYFFIKGKGIKGYLLNYRNLRLQIKNNEPDIIHAHFSLSALVVNIQRKVPVISTFHGSDINNISLRFFSMIVALLSKKTIYVSKQIYKKALLKFAKKKSIIPCGVDLNIFTPKNENIIYDEFKSTNTKKQILFSSSFNNKVKNYGLLEKAILHIPNYNINIIELKDLSRKDVSNLMNSVDLCVMTSLSEGSPQFIKEAMACNCPIVCTDIGDVREIISETEGCFITSFDPKDVGEKIVTALEFGKRTNGRNKMKRFDNKIIAQKIVNIYYDILLKKT